MTEMLTVLIVDDNRTNLSLMDMLVRKLPNCTTQRYAESREVIEGLDGLAFDVAVIDYRMPEVNGVELTRAIRSVPRFADKPIVMVTLDQESEIKMAALEAGVVEFLHKPIEPVEFKTRIRNLARLSDAQRRLANQRDWLRAEVDKATAELRWREEEIVNRLTRAAGFKDNETANHTLRMARYSGILARRLGLAEDFCRDVQLAAPMHDIGKVGIRDSILLKQGVLDADERLQMQEHARIGGVILADSACGLLQLASDIARTHHERWDGTGYPAGLKGEDIPIAGRIAAVADVFDALTSARPYKQAWTMGQAMDHLAEQAGRHFDPACVQAFQEAVEEIAAVMAAMSDAGPTAKHEGWLGREGSNLRMAESKSAALPLGDAPSSGAPYNGPAHACIVRKAPL